MSAALLLGEQRHSGHAMQGGTCSCTCHCRSVARLLEVLTHAHAYVLSCMHLQVQEWLSKFGDVHEASFKTKRSGGALLRRRGIVFASVSPAAAEALLKLDSTVLEGRSLQVTPYVKGFVAPDETQQPQQSGGGGGEGGSGQTQ